jgi:hypothetical protein
MSEARSGDPNTRQPRDSESDPVKSTDSKPFFFHSSNEFFLFMYAVQQLCPQSVVMQDGVSYRRLTGNNHSDGIPRQFIP